MRKEQSEKPKRLRAREREKLREGKRERNKEFKSLHAIKKQEFAEKKTCFLFLFRLIPEFEENEPIKIFVLIFFRANLNETHCKEIDRNLFPVTQKTDQRPVSF